jgi:hypothetical protein
MAIIKPRSREKVVITYNPSQKTKIPENLQWPNKPYLARATNPRKTKKLASRLSKPNVKYVV